MVTLNKEGRCQVLSGATGQATPTRLRDADETRASTRHIALISPSRRGRDPCEYEAYSPDPLADRKVTLDGDVAADVTDAEAAINRLNTGASALADTEALARLLLRAELAQELGERTLDVTAEEVLGNIEAMNGAVSEIGPGDQITVDTMLRFHRRLMVSSRDRGHAGKLRQKQNWIGGSA